MSGGCHAPQRAMPSFGMDDLGYMDDTGAEFRRACDLADAGNFAEAATLFVAVMNDAGCSPAGHNSCIINLGKCYHRTGDHKSALDHLMWGLDNPALGADLRTDWLEMFFASYKGTTATNDPPHFLEF